MKNIKTRVCPTCSSFIPIKSFRNFVKWCKGGCSKLICKECSLTGYCTDCYITLHPLHEIDLYNYDKYKLMVTT